MPPFGLVMDPCFEEHLTGPGHAERPDRLSHLRAVLERSGIADRCDRVPLETADDVLLELVHDKDHIRRVEEACRQGRTFVDSMDTAICPESARIARLAAGSLTALCRRVARGEQSGGFAAVRPPGHHAERDLAMGFCLFNSAAIAARALVTDGLVSRVLIVDWDVHHGNGTQHIFEKDPGAFYFSVHQSPLYPGTGSREETGTAAGEGTTLNCPLPPGSGDDPFLATLREELVSAAEAFRPEFVLLSAGFDAHRDDPLASLEVSTDAYRAATEIASGIAAQFAGGRLVSVLEGGYDLNALGESVVAHLESLLTSRRPGPGSARPATP
jgi:acetoin utilization deacetylase AcuC-like enzyme